MSGLWAFVPVSRIVEAHETDGVEVWRYEPDGRIVAMIDGVAMAARLPQRRAKTLAFPFAAECPLSRVFAVGRALDFAERRLRHGAGAIPCVLEAVAHPNAAAEEARWRSSIEAERMGEAAPRASRAGEADDSDDAG